MPVLKIKDSNGVWHPIPANLIGEVEIPTEVRTELEMYTAGQTFGKWNSARFATKKYDGWCICGYYKNSNGIFTAICVSNVSNACKIDGGPYSGTLSDFVYNDAVWYACRLGFDTGSFDINTENPIAKFIGDYTGDANHGVNLIATDLLNYYYRITD